MDQFDLAAIKDWFLKTRFMAMEAKKQVDAEFPDNPGMRRFWSYKWNVVLEFVDFELGQVQELKRM